MIYRILFAAALTAGLLSAPSSVCAATTFSGDLLSYQQLMELPKPTRIEYMRDLAKLLKQMEEAEASGKYADNQSQWQEMKEQIAFMLQAFAILPEAEAKTVKPKAKKTAASQLPETPDVTDQAQDQQAQAPVEPFQSHQAFSGSCERPQFACRDMSQADRDKAAAEYRKDSSDNSCISGGFFSTYSTRNKRPGTCRIVKEFPPNSRAPAFSCQKFYKKANYALCNPWVFCLKSKYNLTNPDGSQSKTVDEAAAPFCVEYSHQKTNNDITKSCEDQWANAVSNKEQVGTDEKGKPIFGGGLGLSLYNDGNKKPLEIHKCDPGEVNLQGLQQAWDELGQSIKDRYKAHCQDKPSFQAMFCNECQKMADQIYSMNKKADGSGCAPAINPLPDSGAPGTPAEAIPEQQSVPQQPYTGGG